MGGGGGRGAAQRLLAALIICALPTIANAQPSPPPLRPAERKAEISRLLDALKSAPDEGTADGIENQVIDLWAKAGSPAATLLMGRGARNIENNADADAVQDFTDTLALEPDLVEAFHQRAAARFQDGDYAGAVADLGEALKREPRHFPSLQSLSRIAEARSDWAAALLAWQKALEVDPKMPGGADRLKMLRDKVYGEQS